MLQTKLLLGLKNKPALRCLKHVERAAEGRGGEADKHNPYQTHLHRDIPQLNAKGDLLYTVASFYRE